MNLAAANYESQIGVEFKLEYYVKRCKGLVCAPGHQYTNTNANALLDELPARWESGSLASNAAGPSTSSRARTSTAASSGSPTWTSCATRSRGTRGTASTST